MHADEPEAELSAPAEQAAARFDLLGGSRWVRSGGYRIEQGRIRLEAGAELEVYDPWQQWRERADEERPYKRLLRLAQQLRPPRFYGPLPRREERLLEAWVRENGLLGILPHETLEADFAARWAPAAPHAGDPEDHGLVAVQRRQLWSAGHWPVHMGRVGEARSADLALEGGLVDQAELGGKAQPLEALRRRLPDAGIERRPLAVHYHPYFPEVPEAESLTYAYPGIDSDRFWRQYAESTFAFVRAARYLAAPLEALPRLQKASLSSDDRLLIGRALERVSAIASVVDFGGALGEQDRLVAGWSSPSLLGMYAFMLLHDLRAGHEVKRCPNCEVFFLARNTRAVYCSSTCRHAQQKREWRRARREREGKPEGE